MNIKVTLEERDDYRPTFLKVRFAPVDFNLAFRHSRYDPLMRRGGKEMQQLEARYAIRSFCYLLEKEIAAALPDDLKY